MRSLELFFVLTIMSVMPVAAVEDASSAGELVVRPFYWALPSQWPSPYTARVASEFIKLAAGQADAAIVVDPRWWTVIAGSLDFRRFRGLRSFKADGDRVLLTLYGSGASTDVAFTFVGLELQSVRPVPRDVELRQRADFLRRHLGDLFSGDDVSDHGSVGQ